MSDKRESRALPDAIRKVYNAEDVQNVTCPRCQAHPTPGAYICDRWAAWPYDGRVHVVCGTCGHEYIRDFKKGKGPQ